MKPRRFSAANGTLRWPASPIVAAPGRCRSMRTSCSVAAVVRLSCSPPAIRSGMAPVEALSRSCRPASGSHVPRRRRSRWWRLVWAGGSRTQSASVFTLRHSNGWCRIFRAVHGSSVWCAMARRPPISRAGSRSVAGGRQRCGRCARSAARANPLRSIALTPMLAIQATAWSRLPWRRGEGKDSRAARAFSTHCLCMTGS